MNFLEIPGLTYVPEFISIEEEARLIESIEDSFWLDDMRRRVQHYGYRYDYKARRIDTRMRIGQLPDWVDGVTRRLTGAGMFTHCPDQLIINEYFPGQGIAPHIDCEPCFENVIASVSLGSAVSMDFRRDAKKLSIHLARRSVIILQGESRYDWKHGIAARKSDLIAGVRVPRSRRISLTFRRVILDS